MNGRALLRALAASALVLAFLGAAPEGPAQSPPARFPTVAGWHLTADSAHYSPQNLWDYIDGAAEVYLSYGFEDLATAEYRRSADSVDVRVELYRHSSPANAFGIYALERQPDYHFITIGTEGYLEERVLDVLAGHVYVKCMTHARGDTARRALEEVAVRVIEHLHEDLAWPPPLVLFPDSGKIAYGSGYAAENFLGYGLFRGVFTQRYRSQGAVQLQLFLADCGSPPGAEATLASYLATCSDRSTVCEGTLLTVADPNNGPVGVGRIGRYLYGVTACTDAAARAAYGAMLGRRLARDPHESSRAGGM